MTTDDLLARADSLIATGIAPAVVRDLVAEVRALTALLRRLAEDGYPADGETGDCVLCGAVGKPMGVTLAVADDDHHDDCVWALARAAITDPTPQTEPCRCPNHIAHDAFCTERCICGGTADPTPQTEGT